MQRIKKLRKKNLEKPSKTQDKKIIHEGENIVIKGKRNWELQLRT